MLAPSAKALKSVRLADRTVLRIPNPFSPNHKKTNGQANQKNPGLASLSGNKPHDKFQKRHPTAIYSKHQRIRETPAYLLTIQAALDKWPFSSGKFVYAQLTKPLSLWLTQPFALAADILVGPLALLSPAKARANNYLQIGIGLVGLAVLIHVLLNGNIPNLDILHSGFLARTPTAIILYYASIWAPIIFGYCGASFTFASFRYRMRRSYLSWITAKLKQIPAFDSGVEFWLGDRRTGVRLALPRPAHRNQYLWIYGIRQNSGNHESASGPNLPAT